VLSLNRVRAGRFDRRVRLVVLGVATLVGAFVVIWLYNVAFVQGELQPARTVVRAALLALSVVVATLWVKSWLAPAGDIDRNLVRPIMSQVRKLSNYGDLIPTPLKHIDISLQPEVRFVRDVRNRSAALVGKSDLIEVFDAAGQQLLLLGEPGSGKSVAGFVVVEELDARSMNPILVQLSSWGFLTQQTEATAEMFVDFLVAYLCDATVGYGLGDSAEARRWMLSDDYSLVLDGLDEIEDPSARLTCLTSLDAFLTTLRPSLAVLVTTRIDEYQHLDMGPGWQPARLSAAVLEPLGDDMVDTVCVLLSQQNPRWASIVGSDDFAIGDVREALRSPLMLSLVASSHLDPQTLITAASDGDRLEPLIVREYVQRMFETHPTLEPGDALEFVRKCFSGRLDHYPSAVAKSTWINPGVLGYVVAAASLAVSLGGWWRGGLWFFGFLAIFLVSGVKADSDPGARLLPQDWYYRRQDGARSFVLSSEPPLANARVVPAAISLVCAGLSAAAHAWGAFGLSMGWNWLVFVLSAFAAWSCCVSAYLVVDESIHNDEYHPLAGFSALIGLVMAGGVQLGSGPISWPSFWLLAASLVACGAANVHSILAVLPRIGVAVADGSSPTVRPVRLPGSVRGLAATPFRHHLALLVTGLVFVMSLGTTNVWMRLAGTFVFALVLFGYVSVLAKGQSALRSGAMSLRRSSLVSALVVGLAVAVVALFGLAGIVEGPAKWIFAVGVGMAAAMEAGLFFVGAMWWGTQSVSRAFGGRRCYWRTYDWLAESGLARRVGNGLRLRHQLVRSEITPVADTALGLVLETEHFEDWMLEQAAIDLVKTLIHSASPSVRTALLGHSELGSTAALALLAEWDIGEELDLDKFAELLGKCTLKAQTAVLSHFAFRRPHPTTQRWLLDAVWHTTAIDLLKARPDTSRTYAQSNPLWSGWDPNIVESPGSNPKPHKRF